MKKDFNIDDKTKELPYSVPNGFFDRLEDDIWSEVSKHPIKINKILPYKRVILKSIASIAAVVLIFLILNINFNRSNQFSDIITAYDNLSSQDKEFLMTIYEDDILINN